MRELGKLVFRGEMIWFEDPFCFIPLMVLLSMKPEVFTSYDPGPGLSREGDVNKESLPPLEVVAYIWGR